MSVSFCESALGDVAFELGQMDQAKTHYLKVKEIRESTKDEARLASVLCDLGEVALKLSDVDSARSYYDNCIKISDRIGRLDVYARGLRGLASVEINTGNIEEARSKAKEALEAFVRLGAKREYELTQRLIASFPDKDSAQKPGGGPEEFGFTARIKVFVSYSHKDANWLNRLRVHLKPLERAGAIELWDDKKIQPGTRWRDEIRKAIDSARIAVLLISADFLASDFIIDNELPPLLASAEQEGTIVIPVIVSPSRYEQVESLSKFQAINSPSRPLASMSKIKQEELFVQLTQTIESALASRHI
jgi:hypothetical protein